MACMPLQAEETGSSFQDWALRCPKPATCFLEQRIFLEGNDKAPLTQVTFQVAEKTGTIIAIIRVPLETMLETGLDIRIDGGSPRRISFHHCRPEGCLALFPLGDDLRRMLEHGREARIGFELIDGRHVGVPVSLLGITAGLKALLAGTNIRQPE
jgi:invasion protein IalB